MNEELIAAAEIGDEALKFVESDLGRTMLGIAEQDILLAQQKLLDVDPDDSRRVREIQNDARVALMFKSWLVELIDKGNAALEVFKHEQEN